MLEIKNVSKNFTDKFGFSINLLKNISFTVPDGKVCSIIAPSGSGKSTLLKIISGLENASDGEIANHNAEKIIYLSSEPSSFPWLNVIENIRFGINDKSTLDIKKIIDIVGLDGYETHYPHSKSLGFRFRISLGRSIAHKPSLIVIDEPFTKMDEETKSELYFLIRKVSKEYKISFLFATTNISEALILADKVYLMKKNPGEVFQNIEIVFHDERNINIIMSEEFIKLRTQIENAFKTVDTQKLFNISI